MSIVVPTRVFRPFVILVWIMTRVGLFVRIRASVSWGHVLHVMRIHAIFLILIAPKTVNVLVNGVRLRKPLICGDEVPYDIDTQGPRTSRCRDDVQQGVHLISLHKIRITIFKSKRGDLVTPHCQ